MDFEEMYRLYFKDVYLFILAMSKSPDIAEEITQETFFKVLKNINKYRGECSVKTWLFQIAKNTYLSHIKKTKHQETEDKISDSESSSQHSMESMCISKDEALSIYKVLHYLEEPYKEVFTLRTLGELSFREIGEILGRSENWARVNFYRGKELLAKARGLPHKKKT